MHMYNESGLHVLLEEKEFSSKLYIHYNHKNEHISHVHMYVY